MIFLLDRPLSRSQDTLCPWWQQSSSDEVEIGQGEHRQGAHGVLVDAPVAYLRKPPKALDHVEGVFAASATARTASVDRLLVFGKFVPRLARRFTR